MTDHAGAAQRRLQTAVVDDGIVIIRVLPDIVQDADYARANLARGIEARAGVRRPLLIDLRGAPPIGPDARRVYLSRELAEAFTALAMVVDANPVGRMMGNISLRFARPLIPAELFSDEAPARVWLRRYAP